MSTFPASKVVVLVSALMVAAPMSLSGCGGLGSTSTVESQRSELRLDRKEGEACCRLQFRPGRNRERCLDDCAHGRFNHGCEIRRDAGGHDAANHDGGPGDGNSDGTRDAGEGATADAGATGSCPSIASVVPPSEDLFDLTDVLITVTPADPNPDDVLTFSWTTTGGTLTPPGLTANTPAQFFECTSVGPQTIAIAVSNGVCGSSTSITINCVAQCGNNVIEPGEECDPPRSLAGGGLPACTQDCQIPTCGNLVLDPGEACDPPNGTTCDSSCQTIPVVCGDGVVEPGETCDFPNVQFCNQCQTTTCGGCFFAAVGGDPACQSLTGTARTTCQALLSCLSTGLGQCVAGLFGGRGPTCYCSDATCSAGANGACAAQFNAVAGTSDPTVVLGQLNDPTSFLNQVRNEAARFGGFGCGMSCR